MCFVIDLNEPNFKVAESDIVCYKRVYVWTIRNAFKKIERETTTMFVYILLCFWYLLTHSFFILRGKQYCHSVINEYTYVTGEKQPKVVLMKRSDLAMVPEIYEGYHSYKEKYNKFHHLQCNAECVIPKGAIYFENEDQYVSETIIIKKFIIRN